MRVPEHFAALAGPASRRDRHKAIIRFLTQIWDFGPNEYTMLYTRLTGTEKMRPHPMRGNRAAKMRDVPLAEEVIAANRGGAGKAATVIVLPHGDLALKRYEFTTGAGEDRWTRHPDHRLGFVYETMWFLAHVFAIPTSTIHAAMQAIPEYRELAGNDLG